MRTTQVPMEHARPVGRVEVFPSESAVHVQWERAPLNIFDTHLLGHLTEALRSSTVREARVVVLHGAGPCWSAGFAVEDHLRPQVREMLRAFRETVLAIRSIPSPTIAQIHGHCLGGGLELAMACDLTVGASSATFGQPEVRLGVFPPFGIATYSSLLGPRRALEMMLLGETLGAEDAHRMGILSRVVPDHELEQEVGRQARLLSGLRPEVLRMIKRLVAQDVSNSLLRAERAYLEELMVDPHAEDGLKSFLSRRRTASSSS